MRVLIFLGCASLAVAAGFLFVAALSWDATALTHPLAETSIAGLVGALGIWWVRVTAFFFTAVPGLIALGQLGELFD